MSEDHRQAQKFSKLFARTPSGQELVPQSWGELMSDIFIFSHSCNALMLLSGSSGSGKTTFIKILHDRKPVNLDIVSITQATVMPRAHWLIDALTPWLTSDKNSSTAIVGKIKSLADTERPILICIDIPAFDIGQAIAPEILSLLNLADSSNLKISILLVGPSELTAAIAADRQIGSRIVLNSSMPVLEENELNQFVMSKIQAASITSEELSRDQASQISRNALGIPGLAIQLIAQSAGYKQKQSAHKAERSETTGVRKKIDARHEVKKMHQIEDLLVPVKK